MSRVRVLVGTRKGAFVLEADGKRESWQISGPHFAGWEIYHVKGSPVDPSRIYAAQHTSWFGQIIQRSDDGGKTWAAIRQGLPTGHIRAVAWHPQRPLECYATQYANLYRSRDGGLTWDQVGEVSSAPLPLTALVISPWAADTVFALSEDRGVWRRRI